MFEKLKYPALGLCIAILLCCGCQQSAYSQKVAVKTNVVGDAMFNPNAGIEFAISPKWTIEAEIGLGWSYTRYNKYKCHSCDKKLESNHPHNYVGPTRAAVNMVYVF